MLDIFLILIEYQFVTCIGLIVFYHFGLFINYLVPIFQIGNFNFVILGLVFSIIACWYSFIFFGNTSYTIFVIMFVSLVTFLLNFNHNRRFMRIDLQKHFVLFIIANLAYLPALLILIKNNVHDGAITLFNADIGSYSQSASQMLHNKWTFFDLTRYDSQIINDSSGAVIFVTFFSTIFEFRNGLGLTSAIIGANWILVYSLINFLKSLFSRSNLPQTYFYAASLLTTLFSLNVYITGNFFIAQIIGMSAVLGLLSVCFQYLKSEISVRVFLVQSIIWFLLGLYTYAHLAVLLIALILIILIYKKSFALVSRIDFIRIIFIGLIVLPQILVAFKLALFRLNVDAGWPLPGLNYFNLFFNYFDFRNNYYFFPAAQQFISISVCLLFLFYVTSLLFKNDKNYVYTSLLLLVISVLFIHLFLDIISYKGWKLFSSILLILIPILVVLALSAAQKKFILGYVVLFLFAQSFNSPFVLWRDMIIDPFNINSGFPRLTRSELFEIPDLLNSLENERLSTTSKINIDLGDYLETMIIDSMLFEYKTKLVSKSYNDSASFNDTCTLSTKNNVKYFSSVQVNLNEYYSIYLNPAKCNFN